jgi:hypothetical protein
MATDVTIVQWVAIEVRGWQEVHLFGSITSVADEDRTATARQEPRSCGRPIGFASAGEALFEPPRLGRSLALPMLLVFNNLYLNRTVGERCGYPGAVGTGTIPLTRRKVGLVHDLDLRPPFRRGLRGCIRGIGGPAGTHSSPATRQPPSTGAGQGIEG